MDETSFGQEDGVSPFQWNLKNILHRHPTSLMIKRLQQKLEEGSQPWVLICIKLTLAYLHFEENEYSVALEALNDYLETVNTSKESIVDKYRETLHYIYCASYPFIKSAKSSLEKDEEAGEFISTKLLPPSQLAAFYAIKGLVHLEFGINGMERAVLFAKKAVKLNEEEAEWNFLLGCTLARVRHTKEECDYDSMVEEIGYFKKAFELSACSVHAVFLGLALIEKIKLMTRSKMPCNNFENDAREAKHFIMLAMKLNRQQNTIIMFRCAQALFKLPKPEQDVELAKDLLLQGLKQAPMNAFANKLIGDIYWKEKNLQSAVDHMKTASMVKPMYSADSAVFTLEYELGRNPDPEKHFSRMLQVHSDQYKKLFTNTNAMEFYIFSERDLFKALRYFIEVVELDPRGHQLKNRFVHKIHKVVNFYDIICNEARIALDEHLYKNDEEKKTLNDVLGIIKKFEPGLMDIPTDKNKIESIIKKNLNVNIGLGRGISRRRGDYRY